MTQREWALGAILCVMLSACGHYGPPVHPEPADKDASTSTRQLPKTDEDTKQSHHGH